MSTPQFEIFLARLYTDAALRARFLVDRRGVAAKAGLTPEQIASLEAIEGEGLMLLAIGFEKKRSRRRHT